MKQGSGEIEMQKETTQEKESNKQNQSMKT